MALIDYIYNKFLRKRLPQKIAFHHGIPAKTAYLFDLTREKETWEKELFEGIRRNVETGDTVVEVGGGTGVCTVVSSQQVGNEGRVVIYGTDYEGYQ